ncbi:MAG: S9 family peptidase [Planctomycetes bacterium]|nr:S9 family peptidase [Planctomycetota bacterium]
MPTLWNKIAAAFAVLALVTAAWAAAPERTHEIEPEDYFDVQVALDCTTSPDGKYVCYTEQRWNDKDQPRTTDLWVVETETKELQRLTFDPVSDSSPQWAPDGRQIYFMTSRKREGAARPYDGTQQVWRTTVAGGEILPVTRVEGGIADFALSKDGRTLYYTKHADQEVDTWKDLRSKFDMLEYGHGKLKKSCLWKLNLQTWRCEKLVDEGRFIRAFAVAPNGRRIAMITDPDQRLITHEGWSRVDIFDTESESVTTLPDGLWRAGVPSPHGWVDGPAWSADGSALAFTVGFDGYPTLVLVAEWTNDEVTVRELIRPDGVEATGHLVWRPKSSDLCFLGEHRARQRVYRVTNVNGGGQGAAGILTPGDLVVHGFSFSDSGDSLTFVKSDIAHGRDLFQVPVNEPTSSFRQLTMINPQIETWKLPQIEIISWKGANGDIVEGILELPPDYQRGQDPLPLVVEVHGGPTAATLFRMRFWIYGRTLLAAKGYALLSPNYRGSTGYGDKFITDLIGHENDWDVEDILGGVDALIEDGIADPDRLGVMGWSNGGFLTNCILSRTNRFKAASSGAGTMDQLLQWALEDTPGHVINYMQGLPWEATEAYLKASAAYHLGDVETPTIIHVGQSDARVPREHSQLLYRALKDYLHVPTELIVYPGEGHGLTIYNHRLAKMKWDLAWFERYILNKGQETKAE